MAGTPRTSSLEMAALAPPSSPGRPSSYEPLIGQEQADLQPVSPVPSNATTVSPKPHALRPPHSPTDELVPPPDGPPRTVWGRIGILASLTLVGGTVVLLGALGFLVYLWVEAQHAVADQSLTSLWRAIAQADWITQSVTIAAAVMRTVMAAQAALTTAMLAALYLESFGTRLRDLPLLSLMRTVTVSPLGLAMTGKLVFSSPSSRALASGLVIATSLLATAGQLISTILVSDLATSTVPTNRQTAPVISHGVSSSASNNYYLNHPPTSYWRFAEWQGEPGRQTVQESTVFTDTGATFRASLPWIDEKNRTRIRSFTGESLVWDARVACFSPNISATRTSGGGQDIYMQMEFSIDERHPFSRWSESLVGNLSSLEVDCTFPLNTAGIFLCNSLWVSALTGVVILDGAEGIADPIQHNVLGGNASQGWTALKTGPWIKLLNPTGQETLSLSFCITDSRLQVAEVEMHGAPTASEPILSNERGLKSLTQQVRQQLGASGRPEPESYRDRGILALAAPPRPNHRTLIPGPWDQFIALAEDPLPVTLGQEAPPNPLAGIHWANAALFQDVLALTRDPALAVQALVTVLNQMSLFDRYPGAFRTANASYVGSQDAKIPVRRVGLAVVAGLVAAHLLLAALISWLFLARTRATLLGHAWQAVAQVVSERTYDMLQTADRLTDGEVADMAGKRAMNQQGVVRRRRNGRQEFGPPAEP